MLSALASELPRVNGWEHRPAWRGPDPGQDAAAAESRGAGMTFAAMSVVRRFAVAGLEGAARRGNGGAAGDRRDRGDPGSRSRALATAGVKRQYLGCAGRVANGINTVHLAYVREGTGHALIGARQWIPREHIKRPGEVTGHRPATGPGASAPRASWPSTSALARSRRPGASISSAGTRFTAAAPGCASSSRPRARPTCSGSPPAS